MWQRCNIRHDSTGFTSGDATPKDDRTLRSYGRWEVRVLLVSDKLELKKPSLVFFLVLASGSRELIIWCIQFQHSKSRNLCDSWWAATSFWILVKVRRESPLHYIPPPPPPYLVHLFWWSERTNKIYLCRTPYVYVLKHRKFSSNSK